MEESSTPFAPALLPSVVGCVVLAVVDWVVHEGFSYA